jgi:hypothetical protein
MADPRHDPDRGIRLRVGRLPNRLRSRVKRLPSFINRRFAFAALAGLALAAMSEPDKQVQRSASTAPRCALPMSA